MHANIASNTTHSLALTSCEFFSHASSAIYKHFMLLFLWRLVRWERKKKGGMNTYIIATLTSAFPVDIVIVCDFIVARYILCAWQNVFLSFICRAMATKRLECYVVNCERKILYFHEKILKIRCEENIYRAFRAFEKIISIKSSLSEEG